MHISDGVLPASLAVGCYGASIALAALSVRKTHADDLPKIAVVTSAFFVASLIHIPLGPTSVHLTIPGLVGILLGPSAFISIALGLALQSLLFQFGGITALGANAMMMGIPALLAGWLFRQTKGTTITRHTVSAALCGGVAVVTAALILALLLFAAGEEFLGVAKLAVGAHLPVIPVESVVSAFIVSFLFKVKPELLHASFPPS